MKPLSEIEADDVEDLVKSPLMGDSVEKLIATRAFIRENPKLVNALIRHLYDKNGDLMEKMYYQLLKERLEYSNSPLLTPLNYNLMIHSAAPFKRHMLLDQLTFETTVLDVPVDNQTFIKTIMCLYYDLHRTQASKDHLSYLYTLYKNDVPDEDFSFGCELIYEYVNAAASANELYSEGTTGKKSEKKSRKKSRDRKGHEEKSGRRDSRHQVVDVEQTGDGDPWAAYREGQGDGAIPAESLHGDHASHGKYQEQAAWHMDGSEMAGEYEELTRREISKRRMDKSKSRLKKAG
jgi:hypothetical protein